MNLTIVALVVLLVTGFIAIAGLVLREVYNIIVGSYADRRRKAKGGK